MSRFFDSRAQRVSETGFASGIPTHVVRRAQWRCRLLLAAKQWRDVTFIASQTRSPTPAGRPEIHIDGKWYITFLWDDGIGATAIRLERRKQAPGD